jgi:hypothetical protein
MKVLLRTNDITLIAYATSLLADYEIECFEMDRHISVLEGSIGLIPRRLMVIDDEYDQARRILNDNDFPWDKL